MCFRLGTFSTDGLHSPVTYIPTVLHLFAEIEGVLHNLACLKSQKMYAVLESAQPYFFLFLLVDALKRGYSDPSSVLSEAMLMWSYTEISPRDSECKTLLSCGAAMQLREKELALCSRLWQKINIPKQIHKSTADL